VKVRQEGDAVYARRELDANVLLAVAANISNLVVGARFGIYFRPQMVRIRLAKNLFPS
jgi:hypothetical protein